MFELIPFERRANRVATYDPFRDLEEFERSVFGGSSVMGSFRTDVIDTGDSYELEAELPGFKKDEISLDLRDGYLTISAEKGLDKDEENKKGRILRQERYAGACSRSFYVGNVKPEDVKAKYEDGVLSVIVPKEDVKKFASSTAIAIE